MGLLDDAIREHLELKRLRGADPSEVILEEREALGSALRVSDGAQAEHAASGDEFVVVRRDRPIEAVASSTDQGLPQLGQETVELDMQSILEGGSVESEGHAELGATRPCTSSAPARAQVGSSSSDAGWSGDTPMEWEVPGERRHAVKRRLQEEGFAPVRGILDESRAPDAANPVGAPDSIRLAASQERLRLNRQSARDLSLDR